MTELELFVDRARGCLFIKKRYLLPQYCIDCVEMDKQEASLGNLIVP